MSLSEISLVKQHHFIYHTVSFKSDNLLLVWSLLGAVLCALYRTSPVVESMPAGLNVHEFFCVQSG